MSNLFTPAQIGTLSLPNRLVRSATAERMSDAEGRPLPQLTAMYRELVQGGVGLIITGHMYVHPSGKAHPEMIGVYSDDLIPGLAELAEAVHQEGGKAVVQINHGGLQCDLEAVEEAIAPSVVEASKRRRAAREITLDEIEIMMDAFGQAARRVKEAGFDGVQIHGAHGYLNSQFLSPYINRRTDQWGGSLENRMRFLRGAAASVREQVGPDFPVLIKFGMVDGKEGGLTLEEGTQVVAALAEMGIDGLEISAGFSGGEIVSSRKGIRSEDREAYFLPFAQRARPVTDLPIILVGGMRSQKVMERVLDGGEVDFISLCRPLITEPDFPNRMRQGLQDKSRCLSSNNCWPESDGEGIECKCPHEKVVEKN